MQLPYTLLNCNYKIISAIYLLLFFGLTLPIWVLGDVIAPHRQHVEVASVDTHNENKNIENRKFSDYTNSYIPEISQNLKKVHAGWLATWTNSNELGRPTFQASGFSKTYLPSWIIAQFTDNPWRFITLLSLFTCISAGFFIILFCREIGLNPLAGLIAGGSLSASPLFMYWVTFPMFSAVYCWAAGALWGVTRLAKKQDLIGWSTLSFSIFSLLSVARKQAVVYHAYILAGFGLYLIVQSYLLGGPKLKNFLTLSVSAVAAGAVLALPVNLDLMHIAAESARIAPDISFFTVLLPKFSTAIDALRFFLLSIIPELFGSPIETSYPFTYNGLSVTLLVVFFAIIGLLLSYREIWGWWLAIAVLFAFSFIQPLYVLGIKYLGFNLSRGIPLGTIMLPLTIIVAYGTDALIKHSGTEKATRAVWLATASILGVIIVGLGFGFTQSIPIRWGVVLAMLMLLGLLTAYNYYTHPALLIAALLTILATTSYPLILHQNPAQIATTSPLVEKVRRNLATDSRFAIASPGLSVLPPNLNAGLGLASIHSYNSLSSRRYHTLIESLGGEMQTYGRRNDVISPDYNSAMFWMSNIGLMLSPTELSHENLEYLGKDSSVYLYKVISRMGESLQIEIPAKAVTDSLDIVDPRLLKKYSPTKLLDKGDLLEFEVIPGTQSMLILSQKFHRDWQAQVFDKSSWVPANTILINDVFQGVLLPSNIQRVRLKFEPYARFSWIAHIIWLTLLTFIGFRAIKSKWNRANKRAMLK